MSGKINGANPLNQIGPKAAKRTRLRQVATWLLKVRNANPG